MIYCKLAALPAGIGRVRTGALHSLELQDNGYAYLRPQAPGALC